ncbi:MAG TPA: hypothetical protein VIU65_11715, partial [Pyrinomonadaceae bacterium]
MNLSSFTHRASLFTRVLTLLIILAGVSPSGAPARAISMMPQCRFDPDGYFYVKGGSPRGFEELDYIQLQGPHNSNQHTNLESQLSAKNGRSYRLASLGEFRTHSSGNGIVFEFTTESIKGVQYQFSGKFRSICV